MVFSNPEDVTEEDIDELGVQVAAQVYATSSTRMFPRDNGAWRTMPNGQNINWMRDDWEKIWKFLERILPVAANYFLLTSCLLFARNDRDWLNRVTAPFPDKGLSIAQSRRVLEGLTQGLTIVGSTLLQRDNA